jgi:hypothetical protein
MVPSALKFKAEVSWHQPDPLNEPKADEKEKAAPKTNYRSGPLLI